jgi:hypothetical protein
MQLLVTGQCVHTRLTCRKRIEQEKGTKEEKDIKAELKKGRL